MSSSGAGAGAGPSQSLPTDASKLLLDTLVSGNVSTYTELYYLATRPHTSREDSGDSPAFLAGVREKLQAAEGAARRGDAAGVLAASSAVGHMYSGAGQPKLALFYHGKCLTIARDTGSRAGEMAALAQMGLACEALGEFADAAKHHEGHKAAAEASGSDAEVVKASVALVRVYSVQARHAEARHHLGEALHLHTQALTAARQSCDEAAEGRANYAVGRASVMSGKAAEGIPYLKNYVSRLLFEVWVWVWVWVWGRGGGMRGEGRARGQVCRVIMSLPAHSPRHPILSFDPPMLQLRIAKAAAAASSSSSSPSSSGSAAGSQTAVAQAYAALAAAHQALGDHTASADCLLELLEVATASGDEAAQAEAAENLGILHATLGRRDEAEPHLQKAFELRKKLVPENRVTRASLDKVRILLGMVKGDARTASLFTSVAKVDVKSLLEWKVQGRELGEERGMTRTTATTVSTATVDAADVPVAAA
jgi:tetratricopeptide (TPR) repeat protein